MLEQVKNVKLKHMDALTPAEVYEYSLLAPMLRASRTLGRREAANLWEAEFAETENIRRAMATGDHVTAVSLAFGCPMELVTDYRILDFWAAVNHLASEVEHLNLLERTNIAREPDHKVPVELSKQLDVFGPLNWLETLGMAYGKSPNEVETWTYGLVHSLMWKRAVEYDIAKERNKK